MTKKLAQVRHCAASIFPLIVYSKVETKEHKHVHRRPKIEGPRETDPRNVKRPLAHKAPTSEAKLRHHRAHPSEAGATTERMSTQNTSASIDLNRQLLYYTIRLQNSDDTLHAWMRHILAYLTSASEELQPARLEPQAPHVARGEGCDGSCDCQTNSWVRELSYEQHCRKLLMSRVNAGDTNLGGSVDEDSLRREASLVMESVNRTESAADTAETPMDIDDALDDLDSASDSSSEWDFVMYDSDSEVDSIDDPSYKPCGSDLLKLDSDYSSEDEFDEEIESEELENEDEETLSSCTYNVRISTSLQLSAAGNTEQRHVKILRQYGAKARQSRRPAAGRSDTSTDGGYFYGGDSSDDEGDEFYAQEWERPSSN